MDKSGGMMNLNFEGEVFEIDFCQKGIITQ